MNKKQIFHKIYFPPLGGRIGKYATPLRVCQRVGEGESKGGHHLDLDADCFNFSRHGFGRNIGGSFPGGLWGRTGSPSEYTGERDLAGLFRPTRFKI